MKKLYKFPLKMHIGKSAVPVVEIGEKIQRGKCIAKEDGLGAKIHSSVSGLVKNITDEYVQIEADEVQSSEFVKIKECDSIVESVIEAGIVGAGGAGFPTHVKLQSEIPNGYIVANCVECEPALKHNIHLIETNPELVIKGIEYSMEATKAPKAYIGIKAKNKKAIEILRKTLKNDNIEIKELRDMYPMGEERALINEIFGVWLRPDQLPLDANCVVLNTETLANIARAVDERKPVIDKDVTIIGKLKSGNKPNVEIQVPIGTSITSLIEKHGGIDGKHGEVIIGGPYTGKAENLEEAIVTKTSGGAIVTIELPKFEDNIGLLVCACGNDEERLRDIAGKMGSKVVGVTACKNVEVVRGINKCKTPGDCPGQVQGIMYLKSLGAKRVLISNCSDCSNTVMCCAPKMSIPVYHHTDHVFRTIDHTLTRRLPLD